MASKDNYEETKKISVQDVDDTPKTLEEKKQEQHLTDDNDPLISPTHRKTSLSSNMTIQNNIIGSKPTQDHNAFDSLIIRPKSMMQHNNCTSTSIV